MTSGHSNRYGFRTHPSARRSMGRWAAGPVSRLWNGLLATTRCHAAMLASLWAPFMGICTRTDHSTTPCSTALHSLLAGAGAWVPHFSMQWWGRGWDQLGRNVGGEGLRDSVKGNDSAGQSSTHLPCGHIQSATALALARLQVRSHLDSTRSTWALGTWVIVQTPKGMRRGARTTDERHTPLS
jgi:hypothetical protein